MRKEAKSKVSIEVNGNGKGLRMGLEREEGIREMKGKRMKGKKECKQGEKRGKIIGKYSRGE
jgi:hypothetical protein